VVATNGTLTPVIVLSQPGGDGQRQVDAHNPYAVPASLPRASGLTKEQ